MGLNEGILATKLGFGPQGWDIGLEARGRGEGVEKGKEGDFGSRFEPLELQWKHDIKVLKRPAVFIFYIGLLLKRISILDKI